MAVTDFGLTNVRKNCYTFNQNGNEVLPRFFDRNRQKADDFCAKHGVISLFYANNEQNSRSAFHMILWENKLEKQGGKKKTG